MKFLFSAFVLMMTLLAFGCSTDDADDVGVVTTGDVEVEDVQGCCYSRRRGLIPRAFGRFWPCGGIGIHNRLKICRPKWACGFESRRGYHLFRLSSVGRADGC